jgi:integrase/recombinase XerD
VLKSMQVTDWDRAQELEQKWIAGGKASATNSVPLTTPTSKDEPLSVNEAWQKFIAQAETRQLNASTIYKYRLLARRMGDFAQAHGIQSLKDFDLEALEAFQAEGTEGPLTRVKKLGQIRAFFCFAFERGRIDANPARLLRGPKVKPRPTLPFTPEEMTTILAAIDRYPDKSGKMGRANAQRLRAFILLLRYTGLRIGDATTLSVNRLVGNKLLLYTAKTGQPVYCVIPEFVADALENVPRLSDKYFFWTGRSSLHTATGSWQRTLRNLFRLGGVQIGGHAHRFRDTFAVELLLAGIPTEDVAVLLGHSNIGITQRHYSPWVRSRQRQLEANLERTWSRDPIVLLNTNSKPNIKHEGRLPN